MAEDWYPWYPALYEADTLNFTIAEDGAYRRLLDWYMTHRRPLPDNDAALATIARINLDEWLQVSKKIRKKFKKKRGQLVQKRCTFELENQDKQARKRGEVAKKGAAERWKNHKRKGASGKGNNSPENHDAESIAHSNAQSNASSNALAERFDATGQDTTLSGEGSVSSDILTKNGVSGFEANGHGPGPAEPPGPGLSRADFDRLEVKLPPIKSGKPQQGVRT